MPAIRRYLVTEVRQVEVNAEDPIDAILKADRSFNPNAETLAEDNGRYLEPKVISIEAKDKRP